MPHINLSREADAILIAPASADFIARLAQGRADELLSLLCLARPRERCPLLLAPAMNREMWAHPATQRNLAQVQRRRRHPAGAVGTATRPAASGRRAHAGAGRAARRGGSPSSRPSAGRAPVLVTAGPTFEAIDPVRGITNHSSGKMGFAIARAAREAGAEVTLVAGPVHLPTPRGVQRMNVRSAQEMLAATAGHGRSQLLFS
jgi:phosphopantothenoylcysteine decarboxylase/phosphopantothenate--cysteine ligase